MLRRTRVANSGEHITDGIRDLHSFASFAIALLPACFLHAGDLTFVRQLSEADTANAVLAQISVRATADFASVVRSGGIFRRSCLLNLHRCFGRSEERRVGKECGS